MGIPEEKENKVKAVAQVMLLVREIVLLSPKSVVNVNSKSGEAKGVEEPIWCMHFVTLGPQERIRDSQKFSIML